MSISFTFVKGIGAYVAYVSSESRKFKGKIWVKDVDIHIMLPFLAITISYEKAH